MTPSFNELETMLRKAAIGAGWPHALAAEGAGAVRWLAERGVDATTGFLRALHPLDTAIRCASDGRTLEAARVLAAGPSALDLARVTPGTTVTLEDIDVPLLLPGLAGLASDTCGFRIDCGGSAAVGAGSLALEHGFGSAPHATVIAAEAPPRRPERMSPRLEVPDALWAGFERLAARTYVPETEQSRLTGAGAGLLDND